MLRAARSLLLLLTLGSAVGGLAREAAAPSYIDSLPESHPHRRILQQLATLPADQGEALDKWLAKPEGEAPAGTAELIAAATEHFRATANGGLADNLWPYAWENQIYGPTLNSASIRRLARLGKTAALSLPPDEAMEVLQSMAAMGRGLRNSQGPMIHGMMATMVEETARSGLAARLGDLDLAALDRLEASREKLPAALSDIRFFSGEIRWMENYLNRHLLPELLKLSRMTEAELAGSTDFASQLRLSGVLEMGDGEKWIMLETTAEGRSIRLKEGESGDGITVVSIDIPDRRAVLRHEKGEAVVDLKDKTIRDTKPTFQFLEATLDLPEALNTPEKRDKLIRDLWHRLHGRPEGVAEYIAEQLDQVEQEGIHILEATRTTKFTKNLGWPGQGQAEASPWIGLFPFIVRDLHEDDTCDRMLSVAIALRRAELTNAEPGAGMIADPWADPPGASFLVEKSADGSFVLRSAFEKIDRKPLSYKFAAKDAGSQ